jgi:hypothetical protein
MLFVGFVAAESLERNESKSAETDPPHDSVESEYDWD